MVTFEIGDLIFCESTTIFGRLIRKVTGSPFSHVALAISSTDIVEADAFIKSREVPFQQTEYPHIKVMRTKVPLTDEQKRLLVENSGKLLGRGYNYWAIFLLFLRIIFKINLDKLKVDLTKLWCSELTDYIYNNINIDLVPQIHNEYVTVTDLEDSPELYTAFDYYQKVA
jgi:hypothetical protein